MSKNNGAVARQRVQRTSAGLRDALFDELDDLRNGDTNPTKANATAKLAGAIIDTVEMELEVQKVLTKLPEKPAQRTLPALSFPLGSE